MRRLIARIAERQHLLVALLAAWLILSSPWVQLLRRIPREAGFLTYAHVALGFLALLPGLTFTAACVRKGRWRLYFPWLTGRLRQSAHDLAGLVRGRIPTVEGGGLIMLIEGLLLLAFVATAATGAAWFWTQGSGEAMAWRQHHLFAAHWLIGLLVVHVLAGALHILDFVRG